MKSSFKSYILSLLSLPLPDTKIGFTIWIIFFFFKYCSSTLVFQSHFSLCTIQQLFLRLPVYKLSSLTGGPCWLNFGWLSSPPPPTHTHTPLLLLCLSFRCPSLATINSPALNSERKTSMPHLQKNHKLGSTVKGTICTTQKLLLRALWVGDGWSLWE